MDKAERKDCTVEQVAAEHKATAGKASRNENTAVIMRSYARCSADCVNSMIFTPSDNKKSRSLFSKRPVNDCVTIFSYSLQCFPHVVVQVMQERHFRGFISAKLNTKNCGAEMRKTPTPSGFFGTISIL